ncbi:MAG: PAS domain S-box protein, partial [Rhodocyclaceae bacterium]
MAGEAAQSKRGSGNGGSARRPWHGPMILGRFSPSTLVAAFGVAVVLAVVAVTALSIWQARVVTLRNTLRDLGNMAQALAETTGSVFSNVDLLLQATAERVADLDPAERVESESFYKLLMAQTAGHPQVKVLGLFDAKGTMWVSTRGFPTPRLDSSKEEYFTAPRDNPDNGMHISPPRKGRVDGQWYIFTSRAQKDRRGVFSGVAGALIRPAYLAELFHRIFPYESGGGTVELLRSDGVAMVRHPGALETPSPSAGAAGDGLDRPLRLVRTAKVPNYPLKISVSAVQAEALTHWRRSAAMASAAAASVVCVILLLTFGMVRQMKRQEALGLRMRANEARLTQAQAMAHLGHWEWDIARNASRWSEEMFRILGIDPGQAIPSYDLVLAAIPADDRPRVAAAVDASLREGRPYALAHSIQRPDGEIRHVFVQAEMLRVAKGESPCMVGTMQDVTELKRAEEELQRFRYLVENVGQEVWLVRLDGRIVFANPAAAQSLGYTVEELVTMTIGDLERDGGVGFAERAPGFKRSPTPLFEVVHVAKDGTPIPKEVSVSLLTFGGEEFVCGFARDVRERKRAEAILLRAQFVLDHMRDSAFWVDEEGRLVYANRSACEMLGYTREELLQRSVLDIDPTFSRERWREYWAQSSRRHSYLVETTHLNRDGRRFPVEIAVTLMNLGGKTLHCSFARDITDRKRAEAALKQSEERLTLALAAGKLGFFDLDLHTGQAQVSPEYARMLGLDPARGAWTLDAWAQMVHPDDLGTVQPLMEECLDCRREEYRVEYRLKAAPDQWIWVLSMGRVVSRDAAGKPLRLVGTHADITQRKDAELALSESEAKYRALFDALTEGIALHETILDAAGEPVDYRITGLNRSYTAQLGIAEAQALGALASGLYREDGANMLAEFHRVARSGESRVFDAYLPSRGRHFHVSAVVPKAGQLATVFEDVTERKRREEELARFTYAVSHDLKSPLVTIRTFLGFLEQDMAARDEGRIAKDMGYMRTAADRMSQLLDELLALSRVGRLAKPAEDVLFQELVGQALDLVAGRIAGRQVDVQVTPLPIVLHGDRSRLVEVFQNLVDNAVKFLGDQPAPRVEIGAEERGGEIVLYVRDNGIGIDPRHKERLFGLFEKLDPSADGTGIGLALVKRIVEVHGGRIWVESAGP